MDLMAEPQSGKLSLILLEWAITSSCCSSTKPELSFGRLYFSELTTYGIHPEEVTGNQIPPPQRIGRQRWQHRMTARCKELIAKSSELRLLYDSEDRLSTELIALIQVPPSKGFVSAI